MRVSKLFVLSAAAAFLAVAPLAAHADTFDISYYYPDLSTLYQDNGSAATGVFFGELAYSFTISSITFTNASGATSFVSSSFDGVVITDETEPFSTTVTLDPSSVDPIAIVGTVSGNEILFNFEGSLFPTDTVTTFDFSPSLGGATPEPSSLVLLGTGALGLAGSMRRRFFKA